MIVCIATLYLLNTAKLISLTCHLLLSDVCKQISSPAVELQGISEYEYLTDFLCLLAVSNKANCLFTPLLSIEKPRVLL